ncbi:MAG TPA: bacterial transcriptional activator domain-containing protein [Solirubrobacteraceae bacterium]
MTPRRDRAAVTSRVVRALPPALLAAVLWVLRPGLPDVPDSLAGPLTVAQLEDVLAFLGWLAIVVLLVLTAFRQTRAHRGSWNGMPLAHPRRGARSNPAAGTLAARRAIDAAPALTVVARPGQHHDPPAPPRSPGLAEARLEAPTPRRRVTLLGAFCIQGPEGAVRGARGSTEQLIAYLALHPRGATRDELTEALWPGDDPRRTRQRLWQSTSEARKLIGDAFISQRGHYALDRTKVTVDTDDLDTLLAEANTATSPGGERRVLERGLGLLRGEPLAGWDHVWADADAGRLRATQAELLERLGRARLATDDAHGALEAAEQGLDRDALNEALWRVAMQAETELGLRESVGRRYERLRDLLGEQLGLEPEAQTRALYRELLGQR